MIQRKGPLLVLLVIDGALLFLASFVRPLALWMFSTLPDCYIAQKGMRCPACGGTRAVEALGRGDVVAAFVFNPFVVLLGVYVLLVLIMLHLEVLFGLAWARALRTRMTDYRSIIVLSAAFGLFGILRTYF